jgi:ribosomal protein S17E
LLYEARLTKNFQINLSMLQKLQSVLAKEKVMTASAA